MKITAIRPSLTLIKYLVILCIALVMSKLLMSEHAIIDNVFYFLAAILALVTLQDFFHAKQKTALAIQRLLINNFSFNHWHNVELIVTNSSNKPCTFYLAEHLDNRFECRGLNKAITLNGHEKVKVQYQLKALKRGAANIGPSEMRVNSPRGLWQSYWLANNQEQVKVYPNFNRLNQQQSLKGVANLPINGLKQLKKRGQGIEFHQLREYRQGDSIRQIDWQATSKRQKLISKEYQEEQNQHIIVMLDAGIRMNISTQQGSHFDAALNALLMLSHTVLKQGDWFSMQSFNQQERWLPAVKGAQNVSRVMNHFYDLHPDESASDYQQAVSNLLKKRSKRALVLLVTTLNDQDISDLLPALKKLQQHHLVALINIKNQAISETIATEIKNVDDANSYCAALALQNSFQANLKRLAKEGILCVDSQPEHLLPYVINTYLNVKHSGIL